jgi:hypothetical protein
MKRINFIFLIALAVSVAVSFAGISAQTGKKRQPVRKKPITVGRSQKPKPLLQCSTAKSGNEEMTYMVGAGKLSRAEKKRIREKYGVLVIPKGETARAKEIRRKALDIRRRQLDTIAESYQTWLRLNPKATAVEIKERLEMQREAIERLTNNPTNKISIASKKWDWREKSISVGPVMNQGLGCNTCWAFAASDAAGASQQKHFWDEISGVDYRITDDGKLINMVGAYYYWTGDPAPFVQDLLNCMPITKEEICESGWHGAAFDFMVYGQGIPLALADGYWEIEEKTGRKISYNRQYKAGEKFTCRPNYGFQKAYSWDYVNSPPDRLPSVEQLKTALIEHGPLVAPIFYDECLENYRGGVFNEKDFGTINHVVLLVGWDDAKGAWLVKNSWGEEWGEKEWGEKGFGWIKYGSNNIGMFAAWVDAPKSY